MWKALAIVLAATCGCRPPLAPGETRCNTVVINGSAYTKCRTGQAPPGWWCTTDPDGFGLCMRGPGQCEAYRADQRSESAACEHDETAICADSGCFTTPAGCATAERAQGRDGVACTARQ